MSYVVLARKYRPQTFEDLVGQIPVSQTLLNALQSGRIAHAYVFSGPRGVGKTTTARLLAKCLNCETGPTMKPCNKCPSCISIAQGSSVQDVLEIDGASNRGIEQIRELRESAKYTPSSSRYRIYIIDEAHQITKDAFGALLKTLEEPPAHVIFMMATTEVQKIPAPILSRCQRFSLRPIQPDLVLKHLKEICRMETIKVEDTALSDIVRFVEGSLRDALSLLDQALVYSPEGITSETLRQLLGLLPRDVIENAATVIANGDPVEILRTINQAVQQGIDLTQLGKDLQDYYHTLLLVKAGVEDGSQPDPKPLQAAAARFDFPTLERNIRLVSRALNEMRQSETPRAVFEIYGLKMGQKTLDPRLILERLEKMKADLPRPEPPSGQAAHRETSQRESFQRETSQRETIREQSPTSKSSVPSHDKILDEPAPALGTAKENKGTTPPADRSSAPEEVGALTPERAAAVWPNFVKAVGEQKMTLAAALDECVMTVSNGSLVLTFDKSFSHQLVLRSLAFLKPLLRNHMDVDVPLDLRFDATLAKSEEMKSPSTPPPPAAAFAEDSNQPDMENVPADQAEAEIQKVMKHFPGTLKKEKKSA